MIVFQCPQRLEWGTLDLPLLGIEKDWEGVPFEPPASFVLAQDPGRLWFIASHRKPAELHPDAMPGKFQKDLWKHDVAELFLADPVSGRYLEVNLSPNGAWWTCEFTEPRGRAYEEDIEMPDVATFAELAPDGSWVSAIALPLAMLRARIDFGRQTRANVTFILGSPEQRFLTAIDLGGGVPDFHRPARFAELKHEPLPDL